MYMFNHLYTTFNLRQGNPLEYKPKTGSKLERTFHKRVRNYFTKLTSIVFSHNGYTSPPIPALLQTISRHPNVSLTFLNKSKWQYTKYQKCIRSLHVFLRTQNSCPNVIYSKSSTNSIFRINSIAWIRRF